MFSGVKEDTAHLANYIAEHAQVQEMVARLKGLGYRRLFIVLLKLIPAILFNC